MYGLIHLTGSVISLTFAPFPSGDPRAPPCSLCGNLPTPTLPFSTSLVPPASWPGKELPTLCISFSERWT